jgi:acetyl/propionyl-CoA carboxylase alpha subunit
MLDFLGFVLACGLAYIAFQQWQLNKQTLSERLIDRRMEVLSRVNEALREARVEPHGNQRTINRLKYTAEHARFLFGEEVHAFIIRLQNACFALRAAQNREQSETWKDGVTERTSDDLNRSNDMLDAIEDEVYVVFRPYLDFSKSKHWNLWG